MSPYTPASDSEIFLNVARFFVFEVRKELPTTRGYLSFMAKIKKHSQQSDVVRTTKFVPRDQDLTIDDPGMSMRPVAKHIPMAESTIKHLLHKDLKFSCSSFCRTRHEKFVLPGRNIC